MIFARIYTPCSESQVIQASARAGSIKRFERLGKISLESLLEIALVLGVLDEFKLLFKKLEKPASMAELLKEPKKRKRGSLV
jgi:dsDNA-specific endonuclease/ATPase MutS2